MRRSLRCRSGWCSLLVSLAIAGAGAEPGQFSERWETLKGCQLVDNEWNDGDSFHVLSGGKEYIFRLYFVDAPETHDVSEGKARTTEQARYWKIKKTFLYELAENAAQFSQARLKGAPFTVITRWEDAKGESKLPRNFAVIQTASGDLAELLVLNGLARIHGHYLGYPTGGSAADYRAKLLKLEQRAKSAALGGWGVTTASPGRQPAVRNSQPQPPAGAGSDIPAF